MRPPYQNTYSLVWGWVLAIALALTWLVWGVKTLWPLLFASVGLWALITAKGPQARASLLPDGVAAAAGWLAFAAIYWGAVRLGLYWVHGNSFNLEPLLPFVLFAPLVLGVYRARISHHYFWLGAALAAVVACCYGAYQHYHLGIGRAYGHMNPITFGNTSVVLSLTCLIGATSPLFIKKRFGVLLLLASVCAAYASLLSGSKGGWLGLVTVYGLGVHRYWKEFGQQSPVIVATAILALVCSIGYAMPTHVLARLSSGAMGAYIWFTQGVVTDASVSFRLELWRMAWHAFLESPLIGVSSAEIISRMKVLTETGVLNMPALLQNPTIDSQFFGDLAEGGVIGLSSTAVMLLCPIIAFARFTRSDNPAVQQLALVAIWICVLFAEFGLSASVWGQSTYRQFYASWLLLLLGLIAVEYARATHATRES